MPDMDMPEAIKRQPDLTTPHQQTRGQVRFRSDHTDGSTNPAPHVSRRLNDDPETRGTTRLRSMDSSGSGNPAPHVSRRLNDEQVSEDSIVLDSSSDHTLWLDYEATLQEQSQYCKEIESEVEDYWAQVELNTESPHVDDECSLRTGCLPNYHEIC